MDSSGVNAGSLKAGSSRPKITVVGSINMDLVFGCANLPRVGETVLGSSFEKHFGGKGANQAVAAARAGALVHMIGCVGSDVYGHELRQNLERNKIDDKAIRTTDGNSGLAAINVNETGENAIVVIPGANALLSSQDVRDASDCIASSDLLMLQLECSLDAVLAAIEVAKRNGVPILLDPAPAPKEWEGVFFEVEWMCPNESEAASLLGRELQSKYDVVEALERMSERGVRNPIVTRGELGCSYYDGGRVLDIPSYVVDVVDSTAAGDAFAGALGFAIASGKIPEEGIRFACAAAAIACTRAGAQSGMAAGTAIRQLAD
ncbi:MAG: ribokinase [Planctomycetota bacterium]